MRSSNKSKKDELAFNGHTTYITSRKSAHRVYIAVFCGGVTSNKTNSHSIYNINVVWHIRDTLFFFGFAFRWEQVKRGRKLGGSADTRPPFSPQTKRIGENERKWRKGKRETVVKQEARREEGPSRRLRGTREAKRKTKEGTEESRIEQ